MSYLWSSPLSQLNHLQAGCNLQVKKKWQWSVVHLKSGLPTQYSQCWPRGRWKLHYKPHPESAGINRNFTVLPSERQWSAVSLAAVWLCPFIPGAVGGVHWLSVLLQFSRKKLLPSAINNELSCTPPEVCVFKCRKGTMESEHPYVLCLAHTADWNAPQNVLS